MTNRYESIGIKQTIRLAWMQHAAQLQLAGVNGTELRGVIDATLANPDGGDYAGRSTETRGFAVNNLMHCWLTADAALAALRDAVLQLVQQEGQRVAPHWALIAAVYPFWFQAARLTGRLFNLQARVTQAQVVSRLKAQYGDRQMVSRHAQFVLRSFVDWGVISDSEAAGSYALSEPQPVSPAMTAVLFESALLAQPSGSASLAILRQEPALFPFTLPLLSGEQLMQLNPRLTTMRYGLEDEIVRLVR